MQKVKDKFKTYCWRGEIANSAHEVLAMAFDTYSAKNLKDMLRIAIRSIPKQKVAFQHAPMLLIDGMNLLCSLVDVAYALSNKYNKSFYPPYAESPKVESLFHNYKDEASLWDNLPGMLSLEEFHNPYWVFKHFCRKANKKKRKADLEAIWTKALSKHTEIIEEDYLGLYIRYVKLIEAAQLINNRQHKKHSNCQNV